MNQETEHKWKRRRRRQRKIKIAVLSTAAVCVIFATTMALSAAHWEEQQVQNEKSDAVSLPPEAEREIESEIESENEPEAVPESEKTQKPKTSAAIKGGKKWAAGLTGWQEHKGRTYYLNEDSAFITGWMQENGIWYYFGKKGVMQTGWLQVDDTWYYLNKDGSMAIGWIQPDGSTWYYLNENGVMLTGWIQLAEGWYYLNSDGSMATGWICDELGRNYYLQENGLWIEDAIPSTDKTNGNFEGPLVALTFDDGPGIYTDRLLNSLEKYGARATFFMLGQQIEQYPDAVRRMDALGCEIGNHSYDHADLTKLDHTGVQVEFGQTNQALIQIIGRGASVARPPYASMNQEVLDNIGMPSILWNIDTLDWQTLNAQTTIDTVLNQVKDGDVILMHDIHQTSVQAAESIIPALVDRGYTLVTVSELAAVKGVALQAGQVYGSFS